MGSKEKGPDLGGVLGGLSADLRADLRGVRRDVSAAVADATARAADARDQAAGLRPLIDEVVRTVTDVDTIKALADTTRLGILRALSRDRVPKSAKELAEELAEPQTKLYRHLKVLLEAGLIEVAETRVVSGIVETRYRAAQASVTIDPTAHPDETREAMARIISENIGDYTRRFLRHLDTEDIPADTEDAKKHGALYFLSATLPADAADEFQDRLEALVKEFDSRPRDPNGIRLEGLVSCFRMPSNPDPAS
ncbi:hypothetical protein GCM10009839_05170 [Catenulispora yoronensis]|uniref:HTH arsR-type domain-containing protein n=1 Tax=Catenulispora yoronensis TaxID=450799 RepID=A0ABN2TLE2_9ACTN